MLSTELLERILATIPNRTIGLVGDLFLDRYLDIDPARDEPSVETGLTAYQVVGVRAYPGALGTVLNNLVALGVGQCRPIAAIGDDGEGYELRQALGAMRGVDSAGVLAAPGRRTPTYTKPMYGDRELNRLDIKNRTPTPRAVEDAILSALDIAWPTMDALLVLDQVSEAECGTITTRVRERIAELGAERPDRFILADSRERIGLFRNVALKPNERERAAGVGENPNRAAFFTRGEAGIDLKAPGEPIRNVPAFPVSGPVDICGAGDSCSAGIACAMVSGATLEDAAAFGNLIASITIQQIGVTGTAPPERVRDRWKDVCS